MDGMEDTAPTASIQYWLQELVSLYLFLSIQSVYSSLCSPKPNTKEDVLPRFQPDIWSS